MSVSERSLVCETFSFVVAQRYFVEGITLTGIKG